MTMQDVQRKIELANESLDDSYNFEDYDLEQQALHARRAQAQATLAVAYALLELNKSIPLNPMEGVEREVGAIGTILEDRLTGEKR